MTNTGTGTRDVLIMIWVPVNSFKIEIIKYVVITHWGGGFQMMTIDDEEKGGVWPMMTSSQKSKIFGEVLAVKTAELRKRDFWECYTSLTFVSRS